MDCGGPSSSFSRKIAEECASTAAGKRPTDADGSTLCVIPSMRRSPASSQAANLKGNAG